ncbi:NUDIX hydrolase [bacterium]|nr:NUDIX hydrolase [bacterium]
MQDHLIYEQSAVIPFRGEADILQVMLITNRSHKRWIIPKGLVEDHLTPCRSAELEALEEAGLKGTVYSNPIGQYRYAKWGGICEVTVFLMKVEDVLDEWLESFRDRQWFNIQEAAEQVKEIGLKEMLRSLPRLLEQVRK